MTEFFGPVLGVMAADDLEHAIELANMTGYGLTSSLESLDRREQDLWRDRLRAGNLYINRGTTGAITLRQPFGGMGKSSLGQGIKAGSPDYVAQFMSFEESMPPGIGAIEKESPILRLAQAWDLKVKWGHWGHLTEDIDRTVRSVFSYLYWAEQKYNREHDFFHLRGQDNVLRYLLVGNVVIRVQPEDSLFETLARIAAAHISGCDAMVSLHEGAGKQVVDFLECREGRALLAGAKVKIQSDNELAAMIPDIARIRFAGSDRVPEVVMAAAARQGFYVSRAPVYMEGRLELLQYYIQQSICNNYHRYGNLGDRSMEV
jgi:RHH-type proline utilization regulon transcriptional repressor/proline dehydrogenase/delta 1-pyrroline-5-carboxylate dehydrogenase